MADKKQTVWEKREEFEDGSYNNIRVEQVSNGYIKTVNSYKANEEDSYECEKSIHTENPLEEKSLVDKLQSFLRDND